MFTAIKTTKVYEQVIDQIKEMVSNGTLKRGDKLPSERELSVQLGVSRASIREALRALEVIGLLDCRQGEGNFVKENFEDSLFEPLSIMFMLNKSKPQEIFELRTVIEVETAALAAKVITEEELKKLKQLIDMMKNCEDENEKAKLDKEFHYNIAKASKNLLIVTILNTISTLIDSLIKDARAQILKNESNKSIKDDENAIDYIDYEHQSIYIALAKHDSQQAATMMRMHMELINENLIKLS
ncbi:FadR/GntR family transcriptional regulator [Clostridium sp. ZS2-4]|uniref:FadR/GntR family transcriptional regulator n=1 Tax=Clostridium sp. ZS2-4 TaxID=2987703 RepID=UPI00227BB3DB|nr:FadR/GntR family transcriptional regulator [Clostridium sp. ZS2-4]MCY6355042.1 FadR/GntR family transcriptional regulator [Clostridium sp. ZS2-4]